MKSILRRLLLVVLLIDISVVGYFLYDSCSSLQSLRASYDQAFNNNMKREGLVNKMMMSGKKFSDLEYEFSTEIDKKIQMHYRNNLILLQRI